MGVQVKKGATNQLYLRFFSDDYTELPEKKFINTVELFLGMMFGIRYAQKIIITY
ncbi:hypothetical protein H6G97_05620 [Nostoc flagelliforme FACHB-838]|uniref:Transposase n=1 Tax=Nostoc flagelliforme FACHB-838 TaxID=2692904 RepID=A0ABR8DHS6_9NOSO|nr:hypothetical protein [Nostoc flagelliforme FACHB-838]